MDASIMTIPADCNGLICSFRTIRAQRIATGSSTVINIELIPAPIFEIPAANSAVGIVVPMTARNIAQRKNTPVKEYVQLNLNLHERIPQNGAN